MTENNQEKARRYQTALCDLAIQKNCIICLPTGCGKTYIALAVAKLEYLPKAIAQNKKIIFLANSIPLVIQQAEYFEKHISSSGYGEKAYTKKDRVKAITGAMGTDDWDKGEWDDILNNSDILVMIPEILKKALNHNLVTFDRINLLILDECHNATKSHPMAMIMNDYKHKKDNFPTYELPRVIGLTATIIMGNSSFKKIAEEVEKMETTMCSRAVTYPEYAEVLAYSTKAQISVTPYSGVPRGTESLVDTERRILTLLEQTVENIKTNPYARRDSRRVALENLNHPDLKMTSQMFNKNKASVIEITKALSDVAKIFEIEEREDKAMGLGLYAGRLASLQKIAFLKLMNFGGQINNFRLQAEETLRLVVAYCDSILIDVKPSKQIETFVSAKVDKLYNMLQLWHYTVGKEEKLCGIVFCKERITAQMLSWMFHDASKCNKKFEFIRPTFIIGSSGGSGNDLEEQKITALKLEETIDKFRENKVNLIFATSVLEEGLDVPSCNLVVRFDPILTYPSFVQSMGRARDKKAKFLVLTAADNVTKMFERIQHFRYYGAALAKYLIENDRSLTDVIDNDKENANDDNAQLLLNPDDPNSPRITLTSSIQLVYQYCQLLSTDRIVNLEPTSWWKEVGVVNNKIMYKAFVALPINAAVRDVIEGKAADNKNDAKRHAFLETCKRLYLAGAFDEKLFPRRNGISKPMITFLDDMDESILENKKTSTKNNFRWYEKMVADSITKANIRAGDSFSAYQIQLSVLKSTTDSKERENLHCFDKQPHFLSILTKLNLSEIQPFCLYGRYGILECRFVGIDLKHDGKHEFITSLTEEQIEKIENFQKFIFLECLKINHPIMSTSKEHRFLIAPIIKDANQLWEINWGLMKIISSADKTVFGKMKSEEERLNNNFSSDEFKNTVVIPWYRTDGIHFYCVCSIQENVKASSTIDGKPNSKSFAGHYFSMYSLKIVNSNQPFLRCAPVGPKLNFLTRKRDDYLLTKEDKGINHDESGLVHLIPEFLNIFPLPASLLIQSKFLPSIFHRIYRLILSRSIYLDVAQTFKWTAALKCNGANDGIKGDSFDDSFDGTPPKKCKTEKQMRSQALGNSINVDITHLDYIHPSEITDHEVEKHRAWKVLGNLNTSKLDVFNKHATRSNYVLPLEKSSQITFESLDAITDFQVSTGPSPSDIMEVNLVNLLFKYDNQLYRLPALTLSNANDVLSLENLEVIGDSFLKYCVSTHIFCDFPLSDEGNMTELRNKLVSNAHLFKIGTKKQIGEYLAGGIFVPLCSWLPPGQKIPPVAGAAAAECDSNFEVFTLPKEELKHMSQEQLVSWVESNKSKTELRTPANITYTHARLGDKSISDCVEALIGVYYMNGGQDAALALMDWIGLRPPDINGQAGKYRRRQPPDCANINCGSRTPEDYLPLLSELENLIDYKFKNKWLLVEAFSHPAYIKNTVTGSYQRLEFIGDAVLDFLVTNHIYKNRLRKSPGELTDLRSALVNNVTFGSLAVRYKLHNYLLLISKTLQDAIDKFETYQMKNDHAVTGHYTLMNDWESPIAMEIEVPKILGDIFESLAGAVFLDSKMSLDRTWTIFYRLMKNEIDEFTRKTPLAPIRELYEKFPNLKFHRIENQEKSERNGRTTVFVKLNGRKYFGTGTNKKQAKQAAAKYALMCVN